MLFVIGFQARPFLMIIFEKNQHIPFRREMTVPQWDGYIQFPFLVTIDNIKQPRRVY